MNFTKINKYNKKTEKHFYNKDKKTNKYTHRSRYTWRTLIKLKNNDNWTLTVIINKAWRSTKQTWTLLNTKPDHDRTQNRYEH